MCIYPGKENPVFVLRRRERPINPGNWNRCDHSSERQQLNTLSILGKGKGIACLRKVNCAYVYPREEERSINPKDRLTKYVKGKRCIQRGTHPGEEERRIHTIGKGGTVDRSCCVPHAEREHLCINQYRASMYK
jgi:hypothetical protein